VDTRFAQEDDRAHHYLASRTAAPLQKILEETLLTPHLSVVISMANSGLDVMIDADRTDSLSLLYRMFLKVNAGLPCIRRSVKESIVRRGREINSFAAGAGSETLEISVDVEDESAKGKGKAKARPTVQQILALALKWVQDVLDLKDKFEHVWKSPFRSNRNLESGMNEVSSINLLFVLISSCVRHSKLSST
jgi:cullin 3